MYYLYILQSERTGAYYIGSCENIGVRLSRHNAGATASTKYGRPWKVVYCEEFHTRTEALKREYEIKSKKSRKFIEYLIANSNA